MALCTLPRSFLPSHRLRRFGRDRAGGAALEFALVLPALLLILLGMMEYGRFFYVQSTLQSATAATLRQATIDPDIDEATARSVFMGRLQGLDPARIADFTLTRVTEPGTTLQRVTLRTTFDFSPVATQVFAHPVSVEISALGVGSST